MLNWFPNITLSNQIMLLVKFYIYEMSSHFPKCSPKCGLFYINNREISSTGVAVSVFYFFPNINNHIRTPSLLGSVHFYLKVSNLLNQSQCCISHVILNRMAKVATVVTTSITMARTVHKCPVSALQCVEEILQREIAEEQMFSVCIRLVCVHFMLHIQLIYNQHKLHFEHGQCFSLSSTVNDNNVWLIQCCAYSKSTL